MSLNRKVEQDKGDLFSRTGKHIYQTRGICCLLAFLTQTEVYESALYPQQDPVTGFYLSEGKKTGRVLFKYGNITLGTCLLQDKTIINNKKETRGREI